MHATTTFLLERKGETNSQLLGAFFFTVAQQLPRGLGLLIYKVSRSQDTP